MGQRYQEIPEKQVEFIRRQKIFFAGTAGDDPRINVSPKGMDSLRMLSPTRLIWLTVTGSGNETAAHLLENPRMTIMFCAFAGAPLILRIYGIATAVHPRDGTWTELYEQFDPLPGARRIFDMQVDLVQTSCGMAVPNLAYQEDRTLLSDWAKKQGFDGIQEYWEQKNQISLDGKPTRISASRVWSDTDRLN